MNAPLNLRLGAAALLLALQGLACAADAPRLAYVQPNANGRPELRLADPATGQSVRVQSLLEAPQLVVWSRERPEVLTLRDSGVYRTDYQREPGVGNPVGDAAPAGLTLDDAWLGPDGQSLLAVGATSGAKGAVSCALYAVPASGPWRRLDNPRPAPAAEDGDCGGFAPAERAKARSVSSLQLARRQQCAANGSPCDQPARADADPYAGVRKALAAQVKSLDAVAIADPGANTPFLLAAAIQTAETPHMARPVHLVARQGLQLQKPALPTPAQVQIGLAGRYALIAEEYSGNAPIVVDLQTGKTVLSLPKASMATWLP